MPGEEGGRISALLVLLHLSNSLVCISTNPIIEPKSVWYYWAILSILIDLDLLNNSSLVAIKFELGIFQKFKMANGGHIGKMKYLRITNDTIFNGFSGSRNQIKMFVW